MGGPAGSGGSDKSDEKKVDTYSQQYQTLVQKKNRTGRYKNNNKIPSVVGAVTTALKDPIDRHNLNLRMKFANKKGVSLQGLSTDEILSKDFKSQLDAKGYTRKDPRTGGNDSGDNQKSIEQPKVTSQMDNTEVKSKLITADKTAPTSIEMTQDEIKVANKRGKKTKTVLTSITGDNTKATLSKKALLG